MEQAIKIAIENGYSGKVMFEHYPPEGDEVNHFLLDPLFWQSLGKGLGWGKGRPGLLIYEWLYHWHKFIDHLASGKDPEEFFSQLNTKQ